MTIDLKSLEKAHREVAASWRAAGKDLASLAVIDRSVLCIQLENRADRLATAESWIDGASELASDARNLRELFREQSPVARLKQVAAFVAALLGFFGVWSFASLSQVLSETVDTAQAGLGTLAAGLSGVLLVASGGVVVALVRGAINASQALAASASEVLSRDYRSAQILRQLQPSEQRLFGLLGVAVPSSPIKTGPIILSCVGFFVGGVVLAGLVGVGASGS